ncbi:MAG: hypothetical protein HN855_14620 [Anaerolineae bacterium]|jgi:hypothetical protein|nr:hypothetical protein [Anaerolineae bacterium]MBT7326389.1 hypothetical protein [Anaerolineae bacterium]
MRKNILYVLFAVLMLVLSACNLEIEEPTSTPTPEVITIVVTATPEPATATPILQATEAPVEPTATTAPPTETAVVETATPDVLRFYVYGVVWHDECAPGLDGGTAPTPTALPSGCVASPSGGQMANGTFDAGEKGIAGVTVKLEIDCSYGAFTTVTDANGFYSMSFTVPADAGVVQQRVCLSIGALDGGNPDVLIPGGWTYPASSGTALYDVVIPVEQENIYDFGWDYQFK